MPTLGDHLDAGQKELRNAVIHVLTADPASPVNGQIWFRSDLGVFKVRVAGVTQEIRLGSQQITSSDIADGTIVNIDIAAAAAIAYSKLALSGSIVNGDISASAAIALSKLATDPLARANHTGTQPAATISNFDTQVRTSRLDQMAAPTADVSLNSQKITTLAAPTASGDAATKQYVDDLIQGLAWKDSARAATTGNITLSAAQTIDGVAVVAGDRVLVKNQTAGAENGIYVAAAGAWTRATDADTAAEVESAALFVEEGTTNADTFWVQSVDNPTLGTTALSFVKFSTIGDLVAGAGLAKTGNTLDVNVDGTTIQIVGDTLQVVPVTTSYGAVIGDGVATSFVLTHNLNSRDIAVTVYRNASPWDEVWPTIEHTSVNTITVRFATAPSTNQFAVAIVLKGSATGASNVQPLAVINRNSTQSIASGGSASLITFNTEVEDNDNMFRGAPNDSKLYASTAGVYMVTASIGWAANATAERYLSLRANGATIVAEDIVQAGPAANPTVQSVSRLYRLAAEGYIEALVYQASGGALNLLSASAYPILSMHRVSS